ncbi:AEC family transporter [Pseudoflavonifractor phocaeensis]|uniref:AEC family transporter n=1 Tax=Pseudoflavonifractor phocaeensis TaxID=1870988 RepID=UPI001F258051|nr:AEC family transporter [Pseudoflavonifractor phocaeensis]MCF2662495.1 AEC family transporter [Pseudoflavonifractor phocaeensis]
MTGFFNALSASLVLLMLMSVGYFMGVRGWMTAQEKKFVSKYIVNIAVPCNCLVGLMNNLSHDQLAQAGVMLVSALLGVGVTMLLSMALATLLKLPRERWGVFVLMAGLSNTLFIGIPVSTQLFGDACLPYLMIYYLGNTTFLQSIGFVLMERAGNQGGGKITVGGVLKSLFSKPPIIMVIFSIALLLLDLRLPGPIMKFAGYISNSVSPLALIYCGFIIYELGLKNVRLMRGLPLMLVVRLGIAPVICLVFCQLFGITGLARDVFIVESALPVVSQVTVMAGAYGADERYAATGACLSTLGSFITIPILMLLLG